MSDNKDVVYGDLSAAEYREARKFARAALRGDDPDPVKAEEDTPPEVKEETPPVEAEQHTEEVSDTKQPEATPAETKEDVPDPLAGLPEDTRKKVEELLLAERKKAEDLQHKESSSRGRLSAFQRRAEEERRARLELEAKLASLQPKETPKPLKESATTPRLKELAENDPAYLEALDEYRAEIRKEIERELNPVREQFNQYLRTQQERQQEEYHQRFAEELDSKYENWRQIVYKFDDQNRIQVDDKGTPVFSDQWAHWISEQPPALQRAIVNVEAPEDALWALENHGHWLVSKGYIKAEESAPSPNPQADRIAAKREQDLKKATTPKSAAVPLSPKVPFDPNDEKQLEAARALARKAIRENKPSIYSV